MSKITLEMIVQILLIQIQFQQSEFNYSKTLNHFFNTVVNKRAIHYCYVILLRNAKRTPSLASRIQTF